MRIGSLFSGYGGLDMAVEEVLGATTAWFVECDKAPSKILAHHWSETPNYGDVTTVDWSAVEPVDVITGGSPCQDLSHAGKRQGMTEGTRSNLWVAMREAIAALRPSLVIWENVRGAYSAAADSEVEPCAGCVGDRPGVSLRALGRVLGDLSELGYDCRWHGLRAADVGAPHGRFRVFVVAHAKGERWTGPVESRQDMERNGSQPAHVGETGRTLLPTPRATDGTKGGPNQRGSSGDLMLPSAVSLLPTPAVNDMGEGKTVEAWDEWTAKMQAAHGNGNGHGKSLAIEAQRLLPTPIVSDSEISAWDYGPRDYTQLRDVAYLLNGEVDAHTTENRSREELSDVRGSVGTQEVRERSARGSECVPEKEVLFPELREHPDGDHPLRSPVPSEAAQEADVRGVWDDEAAARPPQGPELAQRRPGQPSDAMRLMPPDTALAGGPRAAHGCCEASRRDGACPWGIYSAAIHRWEMVLGRLAPPPTVPSKKGTPQLNAAFSEFLMGLPEGHVTDVPGLSRNDQLKALGNGVVSQQAAAALRFLLSVRAVAA